MSGGVRLVVGHRALAWPSPAAGHRAPGRGVQDGRAAGPRAGRDPAQALRPPVELLCRGGPLRGAAPVSPRAAPVGFPGRRAGSLRRPRPTPERRQPVRRRQGAVRPLRPPGGCLAVPPAPRSWARPPSSGAEVRPPAAELPSGGRAGPGPAGLRLFPVGEPSGGDPWCPRTAGGYRARVRCGAGGSWPAGAGPAAGDSGFSFCPAGAGRRSSRRLPARAARASADRCGGRWPHGRPHGSSRRAPPAARTVPAARRRAAPR